MTSGCANCHTIRGTGAGGAVGPDLTHVASRTTIAAGTLPNTQANLMGWIVEAQAIKPGSDMPSIPVPPRELQSLAAYLETLR
jgi:cytochrome c oxidase subunit 2